MLSANKCNLLRLNHDLRDKVLCDFLFLFIVIVNPRDKIQSRAF